MKDKSAAESAGTGAPPHEIEVTPAMIAAGVHELSIRTLDLMSPVEQPALFPQVAVAIFVAMQRANR
jgi:hypothetical protein